VQVSTRKKLKRNRESNPRNRFSMVLFICSFVFKREQLAIVLERLLGDVTAGLDASACEL